MAGEEGKRLLELQMEELKASYGIKEGEGANEKKHPVDHRTPNKTKIAALYDDAGEYEEELENFEAELEVLKANELKDIVKALIEKSPEHDGNYAEELKAVFIAHWTQFIEVNKTHPQEQLELIKATDFATSNYADYTADFQIELRETLLKRWEMLVGIKKEHVAEERAEMKLRGMKPDHIRKVYRLYHGLEV
jgi:hypothetical protein